MMFRIKKTYLGEEYAFKMSNINLMERTCTLRYFGSTEDRPATISEDFEYVILEKPFRLAARWTTMEELENLKKKDFYKFKIPKSDAKEMRFDYKYECERLTK